IMVQGLKRAIVQVKLSSKNFPFRKTVLGLFLPILLWTCTSEFKESPSGMKYRFIQQYDSTKAKDGEYLMLELLVKNADDSVLFSTKSYGTLFPFRFDSYKMKVGLDNPLEEGFHMMR